VGQRRAGSRRGGTMNSCGWLDAGEELWLARCYGRSQRRATRAAGELSSGSPHRSGEMAGDRRNMELEPLSACRSRSETGWEVGTDELLRCCSPPTSFSGRTMASWSMSSLDVLRDGQGSSVKSCTPTRGCATWMCQQDGNQ
jgi:hypothetical protein